MAAGAVISLLVIGGICCVAILAIQILFCLTLYRMQSKVAERNRELSPGLVWLDMIPVFNTIWGVIMVPKLSNSLRNEFEDRRWRTEGEGFGRPMGMVWAWAGVVNFGIGLVEIAADLAGIEALSMILSLTGIPIGLTILVTWIVYWVQIYQYSKRLSEGERGYGRGTIEEDYDDRYRRPRSDDQDYDRRESRRDQDEFDDRDDDRPIRPRDDL